MHNDVLPLIPCQSMLHRRARANLAVEQQAIKSLSQDILKRGVVAFLVENRRSYISAIEGMIQPACFVAAGITGTNFALVSFAVAFAMISWHQHVLSDILRLCLPYSV